MMKFILKVQYNPLYIHVYVGSIRKLESWVSVMTDG